MTQERAPWRDLLWLLLLAAVVLGAGLGLRDPWPADEPRFALIARDMAHGASWLVPHIGGDLYQDKPPLFFWAIAASYLLTGSLRIAFLLPPLLAGLATLAMVWDLARRLWSREVAVSAALLLLATVQFLLQARAAQIDGFLLGLTTLSLYGLARHLLLGPAWGWYTVAGFAAGLGVITKGVGFLPLLLLLPWAALRRARFDLPALGGGWRWALAPLALLAGIAVWLVPMLWVVANSADPAYAAYRDEILLQQTVQRYANAWHHHAPPWFFLVNVIPGLWLPGTLLLPWLLGRWREHWRVREPRALVFLGWVLLVVLFFSFSSGKRGVYVLPAVPAFVLAVAPFLPGLWRRVGVQRTGFVAALLVVLGLAGVVAWMLTAGRTQLQVLADTQGIATLDPLLLIAALGAAALAVCRVRRGPLAFALVLWAGVVVQGLWINPMIDEARSASAFIRKVEAAVPAGAELGFLNYREQFLLQAARPVVNFGHRRWREGPREPYDAARWLHGGPRAPRRVLLVEAALLDECFAGSARVPVGRASRQDWFLVTSAPAMTCARQGDPSAARTYVPPGLPRP